MDFGADSSTMTIIKAGLAAKLNYTNVGALLGDQGKWIAADNEFAAKTFRQLCNFTDSHPNSSDGALWRSSGPVKTTDPPTR
jgi:hypothetical protein